MRITKILSLATIALVIYSDSSQAEFSGDPGLDGPTTACRYYHTARNQLPLPSDIYKSVLIKGTKCPTHNPDEGPSHAIVGRMKVTNPHYSMITSAIKDVAVVMVDSHLCAVTTELTPLPSNGN